MKLVNLLASFFVGLASAGSAQAMQSDLAGTASVLDGDTIEIHGKRVRLHGIDSPEGRQTCLLAGRPWRCGSEAANALSAQIDRAPVTCRIVDTDRYGRQVGKCSSRGVDLNEWMVRNGWALVYRQYSRDYIAAENEARKAGAGIWAGTFEKPWDWRRKK